MIVLGADTHKRSHTIAAVAAATGAQGARQRGKSDAIDVLNVARAALQEGLDTIFCALERAFGLVPGIDEQLRDLDADAIDERLVPRGELELAEQVGVVRGLGHRLAQSSRVAQVTD